MGLPLNLGICASYVDNYWIKDRTFFSDMNLKMQNAALGMELSGLHNIRYSSFTMPEFDSQTLLTKFWDIAAKNAYNSANNMFNMMTNMPGFKLEMPPMPGIMPTLGTTPSTSPVVGKKKPGEELTDEEKNEFKTAQNEFKKLYDGLNDLDSKIKEELGLNAILKAAKEEFDDDGNTTPASMKTCLENLKKAITEIPNDKLHKILDKLPASSAERDMKANIIYDQTATAEKILNNLNGEEASCITASNIMAEIENQAIKKKTTPIRVLMDRKDSEKEAVQCIKQSVTIITETLIDRANQEDVKEGSKVIEARSDLADKLKAYKEDEKCTDATKDALDKAFITLYKEIKLEQARKKDSENKEKINDMPQELRSRYLDEKGELKPEYKINENKVKEELKTMKITSSGSSEEDDENDNEEKTPASNENGEKLNLWQRIKNGWNKFMNMNNEYMERVWG